MATKVGGDGGGDASASGCSSSCVAARKFAAVAGKVTRAVPASKAMFDLLAVEARPWDEHVRAAVEAGSDAPARVRALQAIGGLADVRGNRAAMWQVRCRAKMALRHLAIENTLTLTLTVSAYPYS